MMIDEDIINDFKSKIKDYDKDYAFSQEEVLNILERYEIKYAKSTIEAIPKDQYEQRLKADLVAILTVLQLDIDELPDEIMCDYSIEDCTSRIKVKDLIQEKINALKEATNE